MPDIFLKFALRLWARLPVRFRKSGFAVALKNRIRPMPAPILINQINKTAPPPEKSPRPAAPRVISTLPELDEMLQMLDAAAAVSDDELRRGFMTFTMNFPMNIDADPDSEAYREHQLKLYGWLHGKPYAVSNEVCEFDVNTLADSPFPFCTESCPTVGNHLIAIGHLIRTLDLKPKSRILEFGPGWGNTTTFLARMGHQVKAVDIEKNFVQLIAERARRNNLRIDAVQDDFSLIHRLEEKFDAVLFFECFHHCSNHQALIAGLDHVVAPGGKVVFGAEPITDAFPVPWGLRLDGESLWAIRKHGWLELGFQETYFRGLLARHGWQTEKKSCSETPWGEVFVATRVAN